MFKDGRLPLLRLMVAVGLLGLCGASCPQLLSRFQQPPMPPLLPPSPTLEQVIEVVNRNNSQIQSFSSSQASLNLVGLAPTLHTQIAFQRPKRLRLRAELMNWPELDLGSNDEGFWFWVKRAQPPTLYYCRHEQFYTSRARHLVPLDPDWLIEAFGIGMLDPALPYQGPFPLAGNRLEIRSLRETATGPMTKITIVDAAYGWIVEQRLHDAQGRLLASATTTNHRRDPLTGLTMATAITIHCPAAQFNVRLDLGQVQINRLGGERPELWAVPNYPGTAVVDLGDPNLPLPPGAAGGGPVNPPPLATGAGGSRAIPPGRTSHAVGLGPPRR